MEPMFHTYQEFYTFTESVIYILIVIGLVGVVFFWRFLTGKDDEHQKRSSM